MNETNTRRLLDGLFQRLGACRNMAACAVRRGVILLLLCIAGSLSQAAWPAQAASSTRSDASHFDARFGCEFGYQLKGRGCVAIPVPAHAYLNSLGDNWDCERGFTRDADRCARIVVPANAHLTQFGWDCNRGCSSAHICPFTKGFSTTCTAFAAVYGRSVRLLINKSAGSSPGFMRV
jgi:hypothetical protein